MTPKPRRLDALTGLRFPAAAAVVVYHAREVVRGQMGVPPDFADGVPLASAAVAFFFVLSGFILAYVYPTLDTPADCGRFLLARFARLWPAHIVGLCLCLAVGGLELQRHPGPEVGTGTVLGLQAAMLHSWYPAPNLVGQFNGASWSVSTEYGFYLLFVPLVRRWPRTWWWKLPLTLVVPAAVVAAWAGGLLPAADYSGSPLGSLFVNFHPLARVYQFAVGMAVALAWRRTGGRLGFWGGTLLELAAVGAVAAAGWYARPLALAAAPVVGPAGCDLLFNGAALMTLPFALAVYGFAGGEGLLARLAGCRPLVFLGDISYGVYILHWALLVFYARHLPALAGVPAGASADGFAGLLLLLSYWTDVAVERPARRFLNSLWPAGGWPLAGVFGRLASPAGRLAFATLLLAAAVGWGWAAAPRAELRTLSPAEARTRAEVAQADVRFGDAFRLREVQFAPAQGGVRLELVWESLKEQRPWMETWLQFVGPDGGELRTQIERPDLGRGLLPAGQAWVQRVYLPDPPPAAAARLVLGVPNREVTAFLRAAGGPADAHGRLVLLPAPAAGPPIARDAAR